MNPDTTTPRTDSELNKTWKGMHAAYVPMGFARQLELELTEAKAEVARLRELVESVRQGSKTLFAIKDMLLEEAEEFRAELSATKTNLRRAVEIAELFYKHTLTPWDDIRAELDAIKATLNHETK